MRALLGAILVVLISAKSPDAALAQGRWIPVETATGQAQLDSQSVVTVAPGQYRVWLRWMSADTLIRMFQVDFDCVGRRSKLLQWLGYYGAPVPRQNFDYTETASWQAVIPGSLGERELDSVCGAVQRLLRVPRHSGIDSLHASAGPPVS